MLVPLVCEVVGASRVAAADRAFLKVPLENVAARESVLAQVAHVRAISGIYQTSN